MCAQFEWLPHHAFNRTPILDEPINHFSISASKQAKERLIRKQIWSTKFIITISNKSRHPVIYYTFRSIYLFFTQQFEIFSLSHTSNSSIALFLKIEFSLLLYWGKGDIIRWKILSFHPQPYKSTSNYFNLMSWEKIDITKRIQKNGPGETGHVFSPPNADKLLIEMNTDT